MKFTIYPPKALLSVILLIFISGCNYYRVITKTSLVPEDIRWEDFNQKYLIVHYGDSVWNIKNISVNRTHLTGQLSPLPGNHLMYLETDPLTANRFVKASSTQYQGDVLTEVHLYTYGPLTNKDSIVTLDFPSIYKMEVYYYDVKKSKNSYRVPIIVSVSVVGGMLIIYGFFVIILTMVLASGI